MDARRVPDRRVPVQVWDFCENQMFMFYLGLVPYRVHRGPDFEFFFNQPLVITVDPSVSFGTFMHVIDPFLRQFGAPVLIVRIWKTAPLPPMWEWTRVGLKGHDISSVDVVLDDLEAGNNAALFEINEWTLSSDNTPGSAAAPTNAEVEIALEENLGDEELAAVAVRYRSVDPLEEDGPDIIHLDSHYRAILPVGFDVPTEGWTNGSKPYHTSGRPLTLFFMYNDEGMKPFMDQRIRKFTKFFDENTVLRDELDMRYSINEKNVRKWVAALERNSGADWNKLREQGYTVKTDPVDGGLAKLSRESGWDNVASLTKPQTAKAAKWVAARMRCISARDFSFAMLGMFENFQTVFQLLYRKRENVKIVWFMHSQFNRSGTWVSLLLWDAFKPHLDGIVSSAAEIRALETKEGWGKLMIIVPDDALYTGGQIFNRISNDMLNLGRDGEERKHSRTFFIAAPFWSAQAEEAVKRGRDNIYFPRADRFGAELLTVKNLLFKTRPDELDELGARGRVSFDFGFGQHLLGSHVLTFFAHKLPDYISVPNNLFALAPYLEIDDTAKTVTVKFTTLINGCEPEDYRYNEDGEDDPLNDFVQTPDTVCPYPPYKLHKWTYNGVEVPRGDMPVEILDTLSAF